MEKPKLLLADDSLTIQRVVNLTFADEGIDVVLTGDGDSALREIAAVKPDIVLADVHMPGPNGYELCSFLRSMEETAEVPVILLVGSFEQFDKEEADRVGANAFVTKPFQSIRSLVDQVKELLAPPPESDYVSERIEIHEQTPAEPEHDTTDIDSLYQRSFAETVEMPAEMAAQIAATAYASDRLDEEMIETSYTADQPDDLVDFTVSRDLNEQPEDRSNATVEYDGPSLDSGIPVEFIGEPIPSEPDPYEPPLSTGSLMAAPTEEFRHEVRDPFASTVDEFDLDEIDLLDLSNADPNQQINFATPTEARTQGSNQQVVSLSPELIEMIVQKVVEKLSEKY